MSPAINPPIPNQLLAALPKKDYQALERHLEESPLVFEELLYKPHQVVSDVYFPNSGIVSLLAGVNDHATLEVGLVGNEGMLGMSVFLGVDYTTNRAVVQGAGSAMKMNATVFRRQCNNGGALPRLLQRYAHSILTQITQSAVCNQFHSVDARLARWLLMMTDKAGQRSLGLTHETLAQMVGGPRHAVTVALNDLREDGAITYLRGRVDIQERSVLVAQACECYTSYTTLARR